MHPNLSDLIGTFTAFCIFPLFVLVPGFVLGTLTNLMQFKIRGLAHQLLLSLMISLCCMPIVLYWTGRFWGMYAVWGLLVLIWCVGVYHVSIRLIHDRQAMFASLRRNWKFGCVIGCAVFITVALIIDWETQHELLRPLLSYDYVKHVSVTSAISRTGLPPVNPSFHPGEPYTLFYYYFWFFNLQPG